MLSDSSPVHPTDHDPLKGLIQFINTHLSEQLDLEQLGKVAGYSHFHINRIFYACYGETLGQYIRKKRLEQAARSLVHSQMRITEIAFQSGYQTPAAFSKAFKQTFQVTPKQIRLQGVLPHFQTSKINDDLSFRRKTMQIDYEIRELPARKVIAVERRGLIHQNFNKAADLAFGVLVRYINANRLFGALEKHCLGITPDDSIEVTASESRYIAAYFIKPGKEITPRGEVKILEIPAGRFAVFTHKGPYETLHLTWDWIYQDWLSDSKIVLRDAVPYEVYMNDKQLVPAQELITEIFIPII